MKPVNWSKIPWFAAGYPTIEEYDTLRFEIEETDLVKYYDDEAVVKIPYGVTRIRKAAFQGCRRLGSAVIPDSVREIGVRAFEDCSALKEIVLPDSIRIIGGAAFHGCASLRSVMIPKRVKEIESGAFWDCDALEKFEIDPANKVYRVEGNCIIENATDTLIAGCNTSVIPSSVKKIGLHAFLDCRGLRSVTIPAGVGEIETGAFIGCNALERIAADPANHVFRAEGNCLIENATGTLISGCKTSVIPAGVVKIGESAFNRCGMMSVKIPCGVSEIGREAFHGCKSLKEIILPAGVTKIGDFAFCACDALEEVHLCEGLREIGGFAFAYCGALGHIAIPESVSKVETHAFHQCPRLQISCAAAEQPALWERYWNIDGRPVIWGAK